MPENEYFDGMPEHGYSSGMPNIKAQGDFASDRDRFVKNVENLNGQYNIGLKNKTVAEIENEILKYTKLIGFAIKRKDLKGAEKIREKLRVYTAESIKRCDVDAGFKTINDGEVLENIKIDELIKNAITITGRLRFIEGSEDNETSRKIEYGKKEIEKINKMLR